MYTYVSGSRKVHEKLFYNFFAVNITFGVFCFVKIVVELLFKLLLIFLISADEKHQEQY